MSGTKTTPRFSLLAGLADCQTSESRRDLLHRVTDALDPGKPPASAAEMAEVDGLLAAASAEYSKQVRVEIARLAAASGTSLKAAANMLALDDIDVAMPLLSRSGALSEATLLRVVQEKSQDHLLAVAQRRDVSQAVSHALVKRGSDTVVTSLLENETADISALTYRAVAQRAQDSAALQAPLIHRQSVPIELLNELYLKVEGRLRQTILHKFNAISGEELEKAFQRSRERISPVYASQAADFEAGMRRIEAMERAGKLSAPVLVTLLREGPSARTAFHIALAKIAGVDIGMAERTVESHDVDTVALLCRGADINRAVFVAIAIALDEKGGVARAEEFGALYESVPVQAAQRALRFWKVRAAA